MKISAFSAVVGIVLFFLWQMMASCQDGSFGRGIKGGWTRRRVGERNLNLTFINHLGFSMAFFFLPLGYGLFINRVTWSWEFCLGILLYCVTAVYGLHMWWLPQDPDSVNHQWKWACSDRWHWYRYLTIAGWTNAVGMVFLLMGAAGFLKTPMPNKISWWVGVIFAVYIPIGIIEPHYIQTRNKSGKFDFTLNIIRGLLISAAVMIVVWLKIVLVG
jgi:hypothetical protein